MDYGVTVQKYRKIEKLANPQNMLGVSGQTSVLRFSGSQKGQKT